MHPKNDSNVTARFDFTMLEEAEEFVFNQQKVVMKKILYNIKRVAEGERDAELFKKLEGTEIWEFRTLYNKIAYRLFAFWDTKRNRMVIVTHGIIKKTQKTPAKEIAKAEKIRQEYLNEK